MTIFFLSQFLYNILFLSHDFLLHFFYRYPCPFNRDVEKSLYLHHFHIYFFAALDLVIKMHCLLFLVIYADFLCIRHPNIFSRR